MKSMMQVMLALLITAAPALAQPPARPAAPPAPGAAAEPPEQPEERRTPAGQPVNIRFDFTVVDEGGPSPSRKALSVTVADRQSGQVRAAVVVPDVGHVPLSVDVLPILDRGFIRTRATLEYQPNPGADRKQIPTSMRLSFGVLLENGRKIVAAQAADPVTDRRVSVEVTATILK